MREEITKAVAACRESKTYDDLANLEYDVEDLTASDWKDICDSATSLVEIVEESEMPVLLQIYESAVFNEPNFDFPKNLRNLREKLMVPIEESAADDQSFEGYSNLLAVIGFASDSIDDEELAVEFRDLALGKIESDWGYQVGITSMIESPTYKLTKNQALRLVEIAETNCSKSDQKFITEIMKRRDQFSDFYEE